MATLRFLALKELLNRSNINVESPSTQISDYYGINVFDKPKMQKYLATDIFDKVIHAMNTGTGINRNIADHVALGMKNWAMALGATHYTHWFHPLSDATAEKHDAFFQLNNESISFEAFDGDKLTQQEPDASSFPSGGIRNTFEARGYTAWDTSSPAFIIGKTLCIPTIFISYTGEALDYKTPLLKSLRVLNNAAVEVCKYFNLNINHVYATLGWEQEYFLIDEALFYARPDIVLTNRTLTGHASAKDQQLEDHYFGSIPERVALFMQDFEIECHKLGIPVKTRHNEVAPNQFECAPIFEEANLAVDHNQLLMDIMARVAKRHKYRVLFHEKPYKDINGSGKHCNWSMASNNGINLLSPGKSKTANLRFLTFLINIVKAVHDYDDLLRAVIASAGNEHRLGANEAPPAIMSVFLGHQLTEILDNLETNVTASATSVSVNPKLKLDIEQIPELLLDNTDRNRTSPFAFTGNRFEFRAVGSSAHCGGPMYVLNTIIANQLIEFHSDVEFLVKSNIPQEDAILQVLSKYISQSKRIRFEGNGYSKQWVDEAAKRGLNNFETTTEAVKAFVQPNVINLFERNRVLSQRELFARYDIILENFTKKIQIESRVLGDLAINHIVPTAIKYQNILLKNASGLQKVLSESDFQKAIGVRLHTIKTISEHILAIQTKTSEMIEERRKANLMDNIEIKSDLYSRNVKPYLNDIRQHIDKLELIIDDEMWPLPKYRELLFNR